MFEKRKAQKLLREQGEDFFDEAAFAAMGDGRGPEETDEDTDGEEENRDGLQ